MNDQGMTQDRQNGDVEGAEETQPSSEPSMEGLLREAALFQDKLKAHEVVWVKVVGVLKDQVQVDIGEKLEALIPLSDFPADAPPAAGSRVAALLSSPGRGERPATLSHKKARWQLGWAQAAKAFADKARVRGTVTQAIKGGFLVDVSGVPGFLPASLADLRPVRKPEALVGTGVRCYILEVNSDKKQIVLSRKAVLEEEAKKRETKLLGELKVGEVRIGRAAHVTASGVFVSLGGLDGFVQASDLAWRDPEKARAAMTPGQKLRVKVLRVDAPAGKVALGVKQLQPNPADQIKKRYPVKTVVKGKVSEVLPDGVRLKLSDGATAHCPVSELPVEGGLERERDRDRDDRRDAARRANLPPPPVIWPKAGDEVGAIVVGVNYATFEVSVSIRRHDEIQDRKRVARYLKGAPPLTLGQLLSQEGGEN